MARAAVAAGADGLIIEVHCDPDHALSDGAQSMFPAQFDRLMAELRIIAPGDRPQHLPRAGRRGAGWSVDGEAASPERRLPVRIGHRRRRADRRVDRAGRARALGPTSLVIGVDHNDVARDGDAAARHRRRRRRSRRRWPSADLVVLAAPGARRTSTLLAAPAGASSTAGARHRHRQHQARDRRGGASAAGATSRSSAAIRLAGAARGRPRGARPDLFERPAVAAHAGSGDAAREAVERCRRVRARRSAPSRVLDRRRRRTIALLAFLSHLPQLTASALMQVVGEAVGEDGLRARRARTRRHDAAGLEPGRHLERHLRDQRRRDRRRARRADRRAAASCATRPRPTRRSPCSSGLRRRGALARRAVGRDAGSIIDAMNKVARQRRRGRRAHPRRRDDHDGRLRRSAAFPRT